MKLKNIEIAVNKDGITVDNEDLKAISNDNIDLINAMYPEGTFQWTFWDQQTKAASLKNSSSMCWHPLYINLYLKHLSSKAYETLRKSDCTCISLPSKRSLWDYTHCFSTLSGFSADIDNLLFNATDIANNPLNHYVTLVMDEVHISVVTGSRFVRVIWVWPASKFIRVWPGLDHVQNN